MRIPGLGSAALVAIGVVLTVAAPAAVRAGNIFDDDWTPPRATTLPSTKTPSGDSSTPAKITPNIPTAKPDRPVESKPIHLDTTPLPTPAIPAVVAAVPSAQDQTKVRKLFREVYSKQLADQTPTGRKSLAHKLIEDAARTTDAPVDRFVMLAGARRAAIEAGDVEAAVAADETLCSSYGVDAGQSRSELFSALAKTTKTPLAAANLTKRCFLAAEEATAQGLYANADRLGEIAATAARASLNPAFVSRASARSAGIHEVSTAYAQLEKPMSVLQKAPTDPDANLAVAKFYCFYMGDWTTGLPLLSIGSDAKLSAVAKADVANEDPAAIGNQWKALANREGPTAKRQILRRAIKKYQEAIAGLQGLAKTKMETQLAELSAGAFRAEEVELNISSRLSSSAILQKDEGFAVLASVKGQFAGGAEKAGAVLAEDGTWGVECHSNQGEMLATLLSYSRTDGLQLGAEVTEYSWKRGDPKVKMIQKNEGFCFISYVAGKFEGESERASVSIGADGFWYLDCGTDQDLWVRAISVKPRNSRIFSPDVREVAWKKGSKPVQVMRQDEGICFLSTIHGGLRDTEVFAGLRLAEDGYWYLDGIGSRLVTVKAMVIRYLPEAK